MGVAACHEHDDKKKLESRVDSLEQRLKNTYKPGFGEFMSGIQVHHAKLWFAGINNNWDLADFEIHEIKESLDGLRNFQPERKETKFLSQLDPSIDSISKAIAKKNANNFKTSFVFLTAACNNCHKSVDYPFNDVKIPDTPPFSNQVFTKKEK